MTRLPRTVVGSPRRAKALLALSLLTALGVVAWGVGRAGGARPRPGRGVQALTQAARPLARNLAMQPAALSLGRRLGQRFLKAGREVSVLEGTLTAGPDSRRVVIRRVQDEGGERVEVTVAGGGAPFTWDASGGTSRAGRQADAETAALAERLALDGPDQFVLAQLRGASYLVVARKVRAEEGGRDDYAGPLHDVVRVSEPRSEDGGPPPWRLYYLNAGTGLLDKVVSEEGGERVEAVLSGWAERGGEWQPSRVTWSKGGQTVMEFTVTNAAYGPKQ